MPALEQTLAVLAVSLSGAFPQAPGPSRTELDVRVSPVVDLHFYVRSLTRGGPDAAPPEWCRDAVKAAIDLDRALPRANLGWWFVETRLYGTETAAEAATALARVRDTSADNDANNADAAPVRRLVSALAESYTRAEPVFLERLWPQHRAKIDATVALIRERLVPKASECFGYMIEKLGMADPKATIPVYITADGPWPGAVTHRLGGSQSICFVAAAAAEGTQLLETVLHEATHGLDIADAGGSVFEILRGRLEAGGVTRKNPMWRDVPHTVMFVQAAETIRRIVDPAHRDYGDVEGYYGRAKEATAAVRGPWREYLDGKITRDEAVERMVAPFVKGTGTAEP
jgi:hypothetical protein